MVDRSREASPFGSAGVVDRSDRGKLRLTGDQALWFCDQLLSNQVVNLADGEGAEALLLTPHGRIRALLRLLHNGGEVLMDTEPDVAGEVAEFFLGRVFATRVEIEEVTDELGIVSVLGPNAEAVVGGPLPDGEHASLRRGSTLAAAIERPAPGFDLWVPRDEVAPTIERLVGAGAQHATAEDYETLRIEGGVARHGIDVDETFLPQEAALERAVHFAKGCYLGQEAVAMAQRGRVKRRLRHLRFEGGDARTGTVRHGGEEVGRVTSAAGRFGIGVVRTTVEPGAAVEVGEPAATATVAELPGTVTGPSLPSARELREALAGVGRPGVGP